MNKINIAIDGPSAAGKSTIAKAVSRYFNYIHLDTGAMYRCVALKAKQSALELTDLAALEKMLKETKISQDSAGHSFLDGKDVSGEIRTDEISLLTSDISTIKLVRQDLVERQKELALNKGYVLDGRDIGTVVLPRAELKIYMTASAASRAMRRYKQNLENKLPADLAKITKEIEERDYQDTHRKESPLTKAIDAKVIDTSEMSIEEVTNLVIDLAEKAGAEK